MSIPLWTLLGFAGWTIAILMFGIGVRRWTLIFSGRAALTSFPGDMPHGSTAYRRAVRAHANCVENLPVYAVLVLLSAVTNIVAPIMDVLALTVIGSRIAQSLVHMLFKETNTTVAVRFGFFFVQLLAMTAMGAVIAIAAASRGL
jgi:uncharacterized MAPEG superfamily protein